MDEQNNNVGMQIIERLIKIETKLESWDKSKEQIYENQREIIKLKEETEQLREDVAELKDRNKWLARAIAGAVISAIVSAIFAGALLITRVGV